MHRVHGSRPWIPALTMPFIYSLVPAARTYLRCETRRHVLCRMGPLARRVRQDGQAVGAGGVGERAARLAGLSGVVGARQARQGVEAQQRSRRCGLSVRLLVGWRCHAPTCSGPPLPPSDCTLGPSRAPPKTDSTAASAARRPIKAQKVRWPLNAATIERRTHPPTASDGLRYR